MGTERLVSEMHAVTFSTSSTYATHAVCLCGQAWHASTAPGCDRMDADISAHLLLMAAHGERVA